MTSQQRTTDTTEWDDIQRRFGNLPPLEQEQPEDSIAEAAAPAGPVVGAVQLQPVVAALENQEQEEKQDEDERQTQHDSDDGEDDALRQIRERRLEEIKRGGRFGTIEPLAVADFVSQVNKAGEGVAVVVLLVKPRHYASAYMLTLLEKLAKKFADVKFLQILYSDCIPGYPEKNLPTLLVYRDDDLLQQFVGLSHFGGSSYGIDGVCVLSSLARSSHS